MANKDNLGSAHNDPISTLFEPDTLASERYQSVFQSRQISPEKRLILAILDDAVQSFLVGLKPRNGKERREFEEAQQWMTEPEANWPFSFESICNALGLDPDYLRGGLEKLRAEANNGRRFGSGSDNRLRSAKNPIGPATIRLPRSRRVFFSDPQSGRVGRFKVWPSGHR